MSKQARVSTDPQTLKPIIEAMIFASEEPLSPRALIRFLVGDRENEKLDQEEEAPLLAAMIAEVETAVDMVGEPDVETEPVSEMMVETAAESVEAVAPEEASEPDGVEENGEIEELVAEEMEAIEEMETIEEIAIEEMAMEEPAATTVIDATATGLPSVDFMVDDISEGDEILAGEDSDEPGVANQPEFAGEILAAIDPEAEALAEAMNRAAERAARRLEGPRPLDQVYVRALIAELNDEYEESGRVFRIVEVAGGFQFATIREFGEFVAMLSKEKLRRRLSPAALETLAIIAYRQPVSKPEVEAIRGVNCDQVLVNLMEKNLVAITGRSEGVGRPLLYGTTDDFLRSFGLKGLGDLPKLREIEELMEDDAYSPEKIEVITLDAGTEVEEIEARVGAAGHHEDGEHGTDIGLPFDTATDAAGQTGAGDEPVGDEHHWIELADEEAAGAAAPDGEPEAIELAGDDDEDSVEEDFVEEEIVEGIEDLAGEEIAEGMEDQANGNPIDAELDDDADASDAGNVPHGISAA